MTQNLIICNIFSLVIFLIFILINFLNIRILTYFTLLIIYFPIHLRFMGRDAITTGTLFIFILYLKYLIVSFDKKKIVFDKIDLWIYLLIICGSISLILVWISGLLGGDEFKHAIRVYFNFLGAMLFFLIIINYKHDKSNFSYEIYNNHIETLLTLFIGLTILHFLISISIMYFPSLNSIFNIFYERDVDALEFAREGRNEIARIRSFVFTPESYGEYIATLCPIILYKIFKTKNILWVLSFLILSLCITLSVTRSGIVLFGISTIFILIYYLRHNFYRSLLLLYLFSAIIFFVICISPIFLIGISERFSLAREAYISTGNFFEIINRSDVFYTAWDQTISNLSLFGNFITSFRYHNLFLTILHQFGIIGAIIFFGVLIYPLFRLIKCYHSNVSVNDLLVFSCILSIIVFLINETKFEFNRHSSYQQICWGLFGTYYLISRNPKIKDQGCKKVYKNQD